MIGVDIGTTSTKAVLYQETGRSELWRQMLVDIFNQEVIVPENSESFCLGACILGLYALGKIDSFHIVQI